MFSTHKSMYFRNRDERVFISNQKGWAISNEFIGWVGGSKISQSNRAILLLLFRPRKHLYGDNGAGFGSYRCVCVVITNITWVLFFRTQSYCCSSSAQNNIYNNLVGNIIKRTLSREWTLLRHQADILEWHSELHSEEGLGSFSLNIAGPSS